MIFVILSLLFVVDESSGIHHRLTSHEYRRYFGANQDPAVPPPYHIGAGRWHTLTKRAIVPTRQLTYELELGGKNVTLRLERNKRLLSPFFQLKPDNLNVTVSRLSDCLYHGHVVSGTGRAAVSSCEDGGLSGLIEAGQERFEIHPLPARFQDATDQHLHIIIPRNDSVSFCGVDELNNRVNFMGNTVNIQRTRRASDAASSNKLYIETAVFADYMLYRSLVGKTLLADHEAFIKYVLAIVNTVQLIYNDPSLGRPVEIVLVRFEILQNENLPFYSEEVDKYLWDFCKWQSALNPGSDHSNPGHWDHAIILTGFDLRSGPMRSVTGYAPVGGMCNPMYSCTINEGNHFGAAFVIAHEMGHSLTMQHDGQAGPSGNNCDAAEFLMSPSTGRGKTTWSTCSRSYVDSFLSSSQSSCLKDIPSGREGTVRFDSGSLPGQLYTTDEQCKMLYGTDFHRYNLQAEADVCELLICANSTVYITGHPALPGTFCGTDHWCAGGACVPWGLGGPAPIHGGWSAWPSSSSCTSSCVTPSSGVRIFERTCTNPAPANGGKQCDGKSKRYRLCDHSAICTSQPKVTLTEFASQQCKSTITSQKDFTLTGVGRQRTQDPTGGCLIWCDTYQGGYKTWGARFPDGTDCSGGSGKSYCVDGQCKTFGCDGWTSDESSHVTCSTETPSNQSSTTPPDSVNMVPTIPVSTVTQSSTTASTVPNVLTISDTNQVFTVLSQAWSSWVTSGPCLTSCLQRSTGIQKVVRKCTDVSGVPCSGRNATVSKCVNNCPRINVTNEMYATKICSALRTVDKDLSGVGRQLTHSAEDSRQACKIWCYKGNSLRSWPEMNFPDGTLCGALGASNFYCLKGTCTEFACDGRPVDPNESTPDCPKPKTSTAQLAAYTALELRGYRRRLGSLSVIDVPETGVIADEASGKRVTFQWTVTTTACSKSCGGGTRRNLVQCTRVGDTSKKSLKVEAKLCNSTDKPNLPFEETCNIGPCPKWRTTEWEACDGECGPGRQSRLVNCVYDSPPIDGVQFESILSDSHCESVPKPEVSRPCISEVCKV